MLAKKLFDGTKSLWRFLASIVCWLFSEKGAHFLVSFIGIASFVFSAWIYYETTKIQREINQLQENASKEIKEMELNSAKEISLIEFKKARMNAFLNALQGNYWDKVYEGYSDGIFAFAHDPHVYPFTWTNFRLLHRNILVPIRVYGDESSRNLANDFSTLLTKVFQFANSDGSKAHPNAYCSGEGAQPIVVFKDTRGAEMQCDFSCSNVFDGGSYGSYFGGDRRFSNSEKRCNENAVSKKACQLASCFTLLLRDFAGKLQSQIREESRFSLAK
jgi:hypothetical protein